MQSPEEARGGDSGRVADYFVVVGANEQELRPLALDDPLNANDPQKQSRPLEMVFESEIVSRYPLVDPENTPSFPDGLTLFCLPDGLRVSMKSKRPSFFSFVQTSDKGDRLVGSCLTFYEKLNAVQRKNFLDLCHNSPETMAVYEDVDQMRLYVPRCLCLISQWPFVESFRKFLCHIYRLSLSPSSIPIERFICNFIDDVPVPPSGKVEVSYLVPGGGTGADSSFIFKRPPINEPNAWNSLPMRSLFECLSVSNILLIFAAVLTERSIVFISSQNHLVALAAETLISLMYPLQWSHVYIPILPRSLLGVLSAPVPLIVGLNSVFLPTNEEKEAEEMLKVYNNSRSMTTSSTFSAATDETSSDNQSIVENKDNIPPVLPSPLSVASSTYVNFDERHDDDDSHPPEFVDDRYYAVFPPETIQVYLDENRVEFGSLGLPPPLPERRKRKLYNDLVAMAGTKCFDDRPSNWNETIRPYYDSAYTMSVRPDMVKVDDDNSDGDIDEKAIRGSFLKFFVSILKNYRKFLVYPSKANPFPRKRFLESEFVASSEADWRVFLRPLVSSQAFHQFVDVRLSRSGWTDPEIIFFDESIDAKINRYTFRLRRHDTPFLNNESNKHTKTFVAPTVDTEGLESTCVTDGEDTERPRTNSYLYSNGFPKLDASNFVLSKTGGNQTKRRSNRDLFGISGGESSQRLRRMSTLKLFGRKSVKGNGCATEESLREMIDEDGAVSGGGYSPACVFSTFLTLWGSFISSGLSEPKVIRAPPTLSQVVGKHLNISVNKTETGNNELTNKSGGKISSVDEDDFTLLSKSPHQRSSDNTTGVDGSNFLHFNDDLRDEYLTITRSAIKIAFELFSVMMARKFAVGANVYRTLANACAVCGAGDRAIDLLNAMLAHQMLPDRTICASIASAISFSVGERKEGSTLADIGEDYLLITPKDVYEAAINNNVKSLVRYMQNTRSAEDREQEFETMLLVDEKTEKAPRTPRSRFSIFSSTKKSANQSSSTNVESDGLNKNDGDDVLSSIGAASPRFASQIVLAERTLEYLFPNLEIDVSNPFGTTCPNFKCKKDLQMHELMENYKAFDSNAYTVTCPYCTKAFVPRFTVHSTREDWIGSEGPGSLLWCELLSPWVLQKEVMTIIEDFGIKKIVSHEFKTGSSTPQYAVLFWNLIVSFRLYGLPYAFLICEKPSLAFLIPLD